MCTQILFIAEEAEGLEELNDFLNQATCLLVAEQQ
jgi:hypothetical protein